MPQAKFLDRLYAVLKLGDSFEDNPITTRYPCIDVGGYDDGLFPVLLFRSRHLIVVDPLVGKERREVLKFDFGKGKEDLTIDYVPAKIQDYKPKFNVGSVMANYLDRDAIKYVFRLASRLLVKDGLLFRAPSADTQKAIPEKREAMKAIFSVDKKTEEKYRIRKLPSYGGGDFELYKKI